MTMRNYAEELENRIEFLRAAATEAHADGLIFGNSGGKDSALVGILCKLAMENTVGVILPCNSRRNFAEDREDGMAVAQQFEIETRVLDITPVREAMINQLNGVVELNETATINLAPRLRMTALYAIAASENRLVVGTGNRDEYHMGYFTKWGDGAYDVNPIGDLTVGEIYEFLRFLKAPAAIIEKAPSAGLYDGQTDESEMGVSYAAIDRYLLTGEASPEELAIIERYHRRSEHKRRPLKIYPNQ